MKKFQPAYLLFILATLLVVFGLWWLSRNILEWDKPEVALTQSVEAIGLQKTIEIRFSDGKSGLRKISAFLTQDNRRNPLFSYDFRSGELKEKTIKFEINPGSLNLHDGEAFLEIAATDYSLLKNTRTLTLKTSIDMLPPQISLLSNAHNINPGGACLTVYRLSKQPKYTGVVVASDFVPGYPVVIGGKSAYVAYFPIPLDVRSVTKMNIVAEDKGGNKTAVAIPFFIRKTKPFRSDSVNLGDNFLESKMPEFQQHELKLRGKTLIDTFVYVNEKMRQENFETIQMICKKSEPKQLWEGIFLRMKNSAPMALFGDKRTFVYRKKPIGNSIHLGVDLASTQNAPIEAANSGIVVHTGYMGIYGNMVIIDHGLGIFSQYSHLNSIEVKKGQKIAKGTVIGTTGVSGLAGGDHLHYGMLIGGKFVNPIEWWDPHWLKDNVEKKLNIPIP